MPYAPIAAVSFEDCRRELIDSGDAARMAYEDWNTRTDLKNEVVPFVEGFTHRAFFAISEEMIEETKKRSEHALGDLKKEEASDPRIEDFSTPFALEHLFHMYLEGIGSVPTWQEWWKWLTEGNGKKFYIAKVQERFNWGRLSKDQPAEVEHLRHAVQWRVGKFYYSAMRELELCTKLRTRFNLALKYNFFADLQLKADLWIDKVIVSVYLSKNEFLKRKK
jgi:hypothetical protein